MDPTHAAAAAWWLWPAALFAACFLIGVLAVPAGIGGGVLFVPIVASFFPFHLDYVRAAGLLVALAAALSASPRLLAAGIADLRLALPASVVASMGSIAGAMASMALPAKAIETALGVVILLIGVVMLIAPSDRGARDAKPDRIAAALGLHGRFVPSAGAGPLEWCARRTPLGLALFALIGAVAGLFGLGAGWGNVPALNLVMGVPLKLAVGTSSLIMGFANASAAFVFLGAGAVLPLVAVPSIVGVMLGARVGARLLPRMRTRQVRALVLTLLFFSGLRMLAKGMGWWA